jgi:hypothetical protein
MMYGRAVLRSVTMGKAGWSLKKVKTGRLFKNGEMRGAK